MPWDARSCRYVFILREKIIYKINKKYWNKNEKHLQKGSMYVVTVSVCIRESQ